MSNCLCLACDRSNSITTKFCTQCGAKLQIQERYRALEVIGQGAFGKTFLAQDEGKPSKPHCVIKQFIYNDPSSLQKAQELFEQEAVRLDDLGKHPQIPELFAHCEWEGRQYLVQEFIDGENLLQELNGSGRFSEAKIKDLLLDLLPVLQFIHTGNVIHRDIKPENIIRRRSDGKLVLVDFGAAKMASKTALAKTGTAIGTFEYMAPEQERGNAIFASDIYALGVTCIYLLTNCEPRYLFSDHEDKWVWQDFLNGEIVSTNFKIMLDKMLEKALIKRYQAVYEILQEIHPRQKNQKTQTSNQNISHTQFVNTPNQSKQQNQILESNFKYITARAVEDDDNLVGWLTLGLITKTRVETAIKKNKSSYIREDLGNGVTMDFMWIPAGKFLMGNDHEEVTLNGFWMGRHTVTQKQWQSLMKNNFWRRLTGNNPSRFKGAELPVERVSWNHATEFCQALSQKINKQARLPTEAEWEYACSAGTQTLFSFGNAISTDIANYKGTSPYNQLPKGKYRGRTVDAESFYPNQWGLYQMHGNVWEWCLDAWQYIDDTKPLRIKQNGNEPWGDCVNRKSYRVLKGGSWGNSDIQCSSKSRIGKKGTETESLVYREEKELFSEAKTVTDIESYGFRIVIQPN
ncbi:MAG: SUMF1/EgtB/PvdO family nonheme iron enzyme [Pseudanabaena sp. M090S1SP2A07QC]|nr:SUMF1/EgtB/PvdO family nonheme iron enzyme [Pseudanabaena sp. M090S1SP2A07QC]